MTGPQILASMIVFQYYIHHAHWTVRGDEGYMFHLLYDRLYDSISESIDQYAEYLVGSGEGKEIPASMTELEIISQIKPIGKAENQEDIRTRMLMGAEVLKTIAQEDGRDRSESRILDDISFVATTTIYLLKQSEENENEEE